MVVNIESHSFPTGLRYLSQASRILASSLDYHATLPEIAALTVPEVADCCVIELLAPTGDDATYTVAASAGSLLLAAELPEEREGPAEPGEAAIIFPHDDPALLDLGAGWSIRAPMRARGTAVGVVHFFGVDPDRRPSDELLLLAEEIALRAAVAVDASRMWAREHHVADTLQRALLPERLPHSERHSYDAAYLPGAEESIVGGDWYDAFELPDGRVAVSIGDVAGHGLRAAVVMGEVRQAFRAAALNPQTPSSVLSRANMIMNMRRNPVMVTSIFGIFDPIASTFTYATAGHPPPIIGTPDGKVHVLPGSGLPLGIGDDPDASDWTFSLPPGSIMVLYTDGMIEYDRDPIGGEISLIDAVRQEVIDPSPHPARSLQHRIFAGRKNTDDCAVLVVSVANLQTERFAFTFSAIPLAAPIVRSSLQRYADRLGLNPDRAFALVTAVGEAVANAVEHAYPTTPGIVHVNAEPQGPALRVSIEDFGRWRPAQKKIERGRGLPIMRALMDGVEIRSNAESTSVRLTLGMG